MAASAVVRSGLLVCAACVALITVALICVIAALTAATARETAQDWLVFTFPPRRQMADLLVVMLHNGAVAGVVLAAAARPFAQFDRIRAAAWLLNSTLAGIALGAYGAPLLLHAGVYSVTELAAWSVAAAV